MSKLLQERNAVYGEMKHIMSLENRSEADFAKFNELEAKYSALTKQIEAEVRFDSISKKMDEVLDKRTVGSVKGASDDEVRSAFLNYVRSGNVDEIRNINSFTSAEGGVNVPVILNNTIQRALAENSDFAEANPAAAEAISKYSDYAQKAVNTAEKLGIIPDKPESPAETAVNKAIPEDDHTETAGTTMGTGFKLNPLILVGAAAGAYFLFGRKK